MGLFAAGQVVMLPYPYSDLRGAKLRPVLLLADAGRDDWIGCQITSNPYAEPEPIQLSRSEFLQGGLHHVSYVRPAKLFTAHESLVVEVLGTVQPALLQRTREKVSEIITDKAVKR